jgi:glycosyltransferase involved in cell wall biosynthesis
MVIGFDLRCLQDPLRAGVAEYTRRLFKALLAGEQKNQYLGFTSGFRTKVADFPNCHFPYPNKFLNFCLKFLSRPKLDKLVEKYTGQKTDLMVFPNFNFLRVSPGLPYVLIVHDLSFELFPEFFSWKRRFWHRLVCLRREVKEAKIIVAVSENTKRDLVEIYGAKEQKVRVVYPGISFTGSRPVQGARQQEARQRYNLPEHFILYLGTLEPRKNIEGLIQAYELLISKLQTVNYKFIPHLVIAGPKGWLSFNIYARAVKSPSKDKIHFIGFVEDKDKEALYRAALLFVYPSFYEGFGFPPLEAAQLGVPTIVSANSSFLETLGQGALLVNPLNIAEIASAMFQGLNNEGLREMLIHKGREAAMLFSWEKCAREMLEIFEEAAA